MASVEVVASPAGILAGRLSPGRTIVSIQVDSGLKYLVGDLYDAT